MSEPSAEAKQAAKDKGLTVLTGCDGWYYAEGYDAATAKLREALTEIAESDGIDAYRLTDIAAKALSPEEPK